MEGENSEGDQMDQDGEVKGNLGLTGGGLF